MDSGATDAAFLGSELKRARIAAGITSQDELAKRLGFERTSIAKIETGERLPSPEVAAAYGREFPALGGLVERWADHIRRTGGSFPRFFGAFVDAERTATSLTYWAPVLVPGILQVEAYARALMTASGDDGQEAADVRVAGRMERQQILSRPKPPLVTVIMSELVLWRPVGGAEVMRAQCARLIEAGQSARMLVQVVPAEIGAHAGLEGAASIAEQDGGPAVAYLESLTAGQATREPEIVAQVREVIGMVRAEALPKSATADLIEKVVSEKWT
jgi:DNA-binding XRE family transcriptional regulator